MEAQSVPRMPGQLPTLQHGGQYTYLLFLALLFFLMSGGGTNDPSSEARLEKAIERRTTELKRFDDYVHGNATLSDNTTSWNNTFELGQWKTDIVQPYVDQILHVDQRTYWRNVSGFLNGEYEALNVSTQRTEESTQTEETELQEKRGIFPWELGSQAKVYLKLKDQAPSDGLDMALDEHVSFVQGGIELRSRDDSVETSLDVQGLQCVTELLLIGQI